MKEIVRSKGIISFLIFIIGISIISTNSINAMSDEVDNNIVVMQDNM